MSSPFATFLLLLILFTIANVITCNQELDAVQTARTETKGLKKLHDDSYHGSTFASDALGDCVKLYESTEPRLVLLISGNDYSHDDAVTWLNAAMASHRGCLDGLEEKGLSFDVKVAQNLTLLIEKALVSIREQLKTWGRRNGFPRIQSSDQDWGLLASWNDKSSAAHLIVAQDGSGNYMTINEALTALAGVGQNRPERVVIYVKSGVYDEQVNIGRELYNVMFVGDGIDETIVTGSRNVLEGETTLGSTTFGKFENSVDSTAQKEKYILVELINNQEMNLLILS